MSEAEDEAEDENCFKVIAKGNFLVVWNLKEHRRSLPTTENRIKVIAEGDFLESV